MRSHVAASGAPKLLSALLGLMLLLPIVSLAAPANAASTTTVSVTVLDANGDEIVGASISVTGTPSASDVTNEDGSASFELQTGSYQLAFSKTGFVSPSYLKADDAVATVDVDADAETVKIGDDLQEGGELTMTLPSTPRGVNGQVLGAGGAGLEGITVSAQPADGDAITTQSTLNGNFTLPLPIETYTVTFLGAVRGNYTYVNTPYSGVPSEVVVSQTTVPTLAAQTLKVDDGSTKFDLKGTTSDWDGNALNGVTVTLVPAAGGAAVATDTTRKIGDDDGAYKIGVRPGKYLLRFEKSGYATTYLDNGVDAGPVAVTVGATGTVSAPEVELNTDGSLPDVTLFFPPAAVVKAPKLTGKAKVGQTLVVSPGTWDGIDVDTDYVTVDWFIDGKPADDYSYGGWLQKFDVPIDAVGKKVGFRITVDDPEGAHAPSVYEGSSGVVPKATSTLKGSFKKGKLAVTLTVAGLPKPVGSIVVKDGKKTVATIKLAAKSKGKAVVKLTKLKPGKHKLTLVYAGAKGITAAKATVKAKV